MGVVDELVRAREAFDRRDWVVAYERLSAADDESLRAADFASLATAAFLIGQHNDCVQALQRAHHAHLQAGEPQAAVRCAFWLAMTLMEHGEFAVGAGWIGRAQRLLDEDPEVTVEHGFVAFFQLMASISQGDFGRALELAVEVTSYGQRFHEPDLLAAGLMAQGRCLLYAGRAVEGLALLDEAMIGVATGEVSPVFAGHTYCSLIEACQEISDFGRVAEWTLALTSWCEAQPGLVPFAGQCAVHRGQVMRVRGAYAEALSEFDAAVQRYLAAGTPAPAGLACAEAGEILRTQGEYDAAANSFRDAVEHGFDPQPGQALLMLARGRKDAAVAAVHRVLAEPRDPIHRSQLLGGAIDVLLAVGDVEAARPLVTELAETAACYGSGALPARADHAAGALSLAEGAVDEALPALRRALRQWIEQGWPYEAARTRVLVGRTLRSLGDDESADAELAAAGRTFERLGARPDAEEVAALLGVHGLPGGLTAREVEVLRLVAAGKSNPEIAGILVLSEKTVARHLSNMYTKLDVSSRTAAAAYAFEQGLV